MADIFISYSSDDRRKTRAIVRELEKQGWTVWWDRDIPAGEEYDSYIKTQMDAARCIVVLWSRKSIASSWVRAEADVARERGALVPVLIENVEVPIPFRMIQAASLIGWPKKASQPDLERFLKDVGAVLGRDSLIRVVEPRPAWRRWAVATLLLLPVPVTAALGYHPVGSTDVRLELQLSEVEFSMGAASVLLKDPLALTELGVSGLREIELALANGARERYASSSALFAVANDESRENSIGIEIGVLDEGTRVAIQQGDFPGEYRAALAGDLPELGASVDGSVHVVIPRSLDRTHEFESDLIALRPGPGVLGMDLTLVEASQASFSPGLQINNLRLYRIPRYGEGERALSPLESTVLSGTIHFESLRNARLRLDEGQLIRFEEANGEIRNLRLTGNGVALLFAGAVRGMGTGTDEISLMPTMLRSIWSRHAAILVLLGLAYLLAVSALGYRLWRQQE